MSRHITTIAMHQHDDHEELAERRAAELDFVSAAYDPEEAWSIITNGGVCTVYRRLKLPLYDSDDEARVVVVLTMPFEYPMHSALSITATVDESSSFTHKLVWDALPNLVEACREEAAAVSGEEAVLTVLSRADAWIDEEWPKFCTEKDHTQSQNRTESSTTVSHSPILGRRLIYSHHLISKIKRADIKDLASHYGLTGYAKIGWPGIILIEGMEEDCNHFYDDIRGWAWKYLVVRGEQQEDNGTRKFSSFLETDDMSIVAEHCREVGLEALFKTSMKVYDNQDQQKEADEKLLGTLVLVDHMNDGKQYRKWLRKTARQLDCLLFIQQCYLDYSKRPLIVVGAMGTRVPEYMKRWRTSRVDVDSKGRPCLERQMTVIIDGPMDCTRVEGLDWDRLQAEEHINVSMEQLKCLIVTVGGAAWSNAFDDCVKT